VARLTTNEDYLDATEIGDRTLAVFVGSGEYIYSTYDVVALNV
jgi:hypothetical protein